MRYFELAEHTYAYAAVIVGISYITGFAAITMRKAWKRALKIGFTGAQLRKVAKASISYAFVPSIAVLAGFFALAPILGIPLSWLRLSVIGNTAYEIMAANAAMRAVGVAEPSNAGASAFILTMYVIAIGIMGGMVIAPILSKRIQKGTISIQKSDRLWGALNNSLFMATIQLAFIIPAVFSFSSPLLALAAGALSMAAFRHAIRRFGITWLNDFALTFSMLAGMLSTILWDFMTK